MLEGYSEIVDGWANRVAENFAIDVARQNEKQWKQHSREISRELRDIVEKTPIGDVMRSIVAEQVKYIKSLPLEAADRIYNIQNRAIETVITGGRFETFAKEIFDTGGVTMARAHLIAKTEVGRAIGALDQARALVAGSPGYIWRTANDGDVRRSHADMDGKFIDWSIPPALIEPKQIMGMTGHAGELPNCRCFKEIVFKRPTSR